MSQQVIRVKTVIIGAGFSGISAAVNLLNNGYNDFLVFEALDRIGGRIDTRTNGENFFSITNKLKIKQNIHISLLKYFISIN